MKKNAIHIISAVLAAVLIASCCYFGYSAFMDFLDFHEWQKRDETSTMADAPWYTELESIIRAELPEDAKDANGHIKTIMLLNGDDKVSFFDGVIPFWEYRYMEVPAFGLPRIQTVLFEGPQLQIALMEWAADQRTAPPEIFLSERDDGTPVFRLAEEDPLYDLSSGELLDRWIDLLSILYAELADIT